MNCSQWQQVRVDIGDMGGYAVIHGGPPQLVCCMHFDVGGCMMIWCLAPGDYGISTPPDDVVDIHYVSTIRWDTHRSVRFKAKRHKIVNLQAVQHLLHTTQRLYNTYIEIRRPGLFHA